MRTDLNVVRWSDFASREEARAWWLDFRRDCIGGSEISCIQGSNPWKSSFGLYLNKKRLDEDREPTLQMELGLITEEGLAKYFAKLNNVEVITDVLCCSRESGGIKLLCTPDALTTNFGLEIKHVSFGFDESWTEKSCPEHYYLQCQWYMHVSGYKAWTLFAASSSETRQYDFVYDEALCNELEQKAREWWQKYIIGDEMPEPSAIDNDRMAKVYQQETDEVKLADDYVAEQITRLIEVKAQVKALSEIQDTLEASLKQRIADGAGLTDGKHTVTWKQATCTRVVNWQNVALELGATEEVIEHNASIKPGSRRLLIKKEKW